MNTVPRSMASALSESIGVGREANSAVASSAMELMCKLLESAEVDSGTILRKRKSADVVVTSPEFEGLGSFQILVSDGVVAELIWRKKRVPQ